MLKVLNVVNVGGSANLREPRSAHVLFEINELQARCARSAQGQRKRKSMTINVLSCFALTEMTFLPYWRGLMGYVLIEL